MSDFRWAFGLDAGFIDHFDTQHEITLNYGAITDLHTLQITITQSVSVSSSCFPVMASAMAFPLLLCSSPL
jgi:hypothetical protein